MLAAPSLPVLGIALLGDGPASCDLAQPRKVSPLR
jgi:hypothetical protein